MGRNVRADEGELDLVALEGRAVVVVEVKAGWTAHPDPRHRPVRHVSAEDLSRRRRAATRIASRRGLVGRVDLVEVWAGPGRERASVRRWRDVRGPVGTPPAP